MVFVADDQIPPYRGPFPRPKPKRPQPVPPLVPAIQGTDVSTTQPSPDNSQSDAQSDAGTRNQIYWREYFSRI